MSSYWYCTDIVFRGLCSSQAKKYSVSCLVSVMLPTDSVFLVRLSVIHKRNTVVPVSLLVTLLTNSVSRIRYLF